jgi:hypothetical protein
VQLRLKLVTAATTAIITVVNSTNRLCGIFAQQFPLVLGPSKRTFLDSLPIAFEVLGFDLLVLRFVLCTLVPKHSSAICVSQFTLITLGTKFTTFETSGSPRHSPSQISTLAFLTLQFAFAVLK